MQKYSFLIHTFLILLLVSISVAFVSIQDAKKWKLDDMHSSVSFTIDHGFVPTLGKFDKFSGDLYFSLDDLAGSKANFTIDVTSVNTENSKRDTHLQSKDFFNAKEFPTMKFVSTKFEKQDDKNYVVHGKLTIRDVTKDIQLPFKVLGIGQHPAKKGTEVLGIKAKTTIDRTDYGVGNGSWAATAIVGDEVEITILMELHH